MSGCDLLLDENLSPALTTGIATLGRVVHVREVGLRGADDAVVWRWAREHSVAIVTKDSDFMDLATRIGPPPKVIQLRLGNCTTQEVVDAFLVQSAAILAFMVDPNGAILYVERGANTPTAV